MKTDSTFHHSHPTSNLNASCDGNKVNSNELLKWNKEGKPIQIFLNCLSKLEWNE